MIVAESVAVSGIVPGRVVPPAAVTHGLLSGLPADRFVVPRSSAAV